MDRAETLRQALETGKTTRDFRDALAPFEGKRIRLTAMAEQVVDAAQWVIAQPDALTDADAVARLWEPIVDLFDQFDSREAFLVLREKAADSLRTFVDRFIEHADESLSGAAMSALRILGRCGSREGADQVVRWIRSDIRHDAYEWSLVLEGVAQADRQGDYVCRQLAGSLPEGFKAVALLDMANQLGFDGKLTSHPFDNDAGVARLETYLTDNDRDRASYAISAVRAIPFLRSPRRDSLMALAFESTSRQTNLEAAWASARLGSEAGVKVLARLTCDVHASRAACDYLEELGRGDAVPQGAGDADFQALAEMSAWLQHPNEFGREPDELELWDAREMLWPPSNERRTLWLVRYRYKANNDDETDDEGIGLVGPMTFALFGEMTATLPPLHAYALYCCWELELNGDPRAPRKRSVEAGLAILQRMNPDLDERRQLPK